MDLFYDLGGTIREIPAKNTLQRLKPLLREFGITRLANITGLDTVGIPVWTVVRPLARSLSVSQGKGLTHDLATVSGIMESIEVSCAEQPPPSPVVRGLFESDRDSSFVSPEYLAVRQDADLSADRSISWVEGEDLFEHDHKWVPAELFDLDFTKREGPPVFLASSNGVASGNTRTEATVHALCEVIERDQVSFWSIEQELPFGATPPRQVILSSIDDYACQMLVQQCIAAGLEPSIWHINVNIDIPVFVCTLADKRNNTQYPQQATGYGCYPIARIALMRAITEAAQSRLTHIAGLREDLTWSRYRDEFLCSTASNPPSFDEAQCQYASVDFAKMNTAIPEGRSMASLQAHILARLSDVGLRSAIVVDLAQRPEFSVVFVCVPGLEYRSPKAKLAYVPGFRMRRFLEQNDHRLGDGG
jgi:YcaO-like protein with predicted kinase domain